MAPWGTGGWSSLPHYHDFHYHISLAQKTYFSLFHSQVGLHFTNVSIWRNMTVTQLMTFKFPLKDPVDEVDGNYCSYKLDRQMELIQLLLLLKRQLSNHPHPQLLAPDSASPTHCWSLNSVLQMTLCRHPHWSSKKQACSPGPTEQQ